MDIQDITDRLGFQLKPSQREVAQHALDMHQRGTQVRLCLYHRTGEGKTIASLVAVAQSGAREALVLAPPITHPKWIETAEKLGITVTPISHAKFRQKDYKVSRTQAVIVDEFHLLGGHTGNGWKKMDRLARSLKAAMVICSATPNYNDAERVYCVMHVLAPDDVKGGYLQFLYQNCETTVNPFGSVPLVDGFRDGRTAEEFLADLPYVHYVEDEAIKQVKIANIPADVPDGAVPPEFEEYGFDPRRTRIVSSQMEERHRRKRYLMLGPGGEFRSRLYDQISTLVGSVAGPVLLYCDSSELARALARALSQHAVQYVLVTGSSSPKAKRAAVQLFLDGDAEVMVGTATMATGLDGVDKVCDTLLIVDDTDDDAKRRQLIGRILPRGTDTDVSKKQVWRLTFS